jgi:hypothetical protein
MIYINILGYNSLVEMWLVNKAFGNVKSVWSTASKVKQFNEGTLINPSAYNHFAFQNNYTKLVHMFQLRLYHVNNTPFKFHSDKLTGELAELHKELNFLHSRLFMTRVIIVFAAITVYYLLREEDSKDWGDRFDLRYMMNVYGNFEDSTADATESLDE